MSLVEIQSFGSVNTSQMSCCLMYVLALCWQLCLVSATWLVDCGGCSIGVVWLAQCVLVLTHNKYGWEPLYLRHWCAYTHWDWWREGLCAITTEVVRHELNWASKWISCMYLMSCCVLTRCNICTEINMEWTCPPFDWYNLVGLFGLCYDVTL